MFVERRSALLADESLQGAEFASVFSALVDEFLTGLFADAPDCALVAVGGYGRGELAPGSDIDVMLVHRGRRDVAEVANRIWYPIWDAGIPLDHGVKTVTEALGVAARDLKAALGLLDARCVAGDAELADDLARRAVEQWKSGGKKWLRALGESIRQRHARTGDIAFLLEPDLKEGRGGLRDVHALRAAAVACPVVSDDHLAHLDAEKVLVRARVAMQRLNGRSERLVLQSQDGVARALGLVDADGLMRAVSSAARTIAWASDDAWRRIDVWLDKRSSRSVMPDRIESPGVVVREGETVIDGSADLSDSSLILRVGAAAASTQTPIATATLQRLRAEAVGPGDRWSPEARTALFDLLAAGPPAVAAFEALDQYDLLTRVLPEWEPVRSKPQHNPYHRYTVDRHLVEAAVEAAALRHRVARPDLLLLGAWLHDLGKGYPGDHSTVGAELIEAISARIGFPPHERAVLVALARDHLLLSDAATRRDVRDPATVTASRRQSATCRPSSCCTRSQRPMARRPARACGVRGRPRSSTSSWLRSRHGSLAGRKSGRSGSIPRSSGWSSRPLAVSSSRSRARRWWWSARIARVCSATSLGCCASTGSRSSRPTSGLRPASARAWQSTHSSFIASGEGTRIGRGSAATSSERWTAASPSRLASPLGRGSTGFGFEGWGVRWNRPCSSTTTPPQTPRSSRFAALTRWERSIASRER